MRAISRCVLCAALLGPAAAAADTIGPTQADALQQQIKDGLRTLLGPSVQLPDMPWRITGEGDHYLITWPLTGLESPSGAPESTIKLRPLEGGRWSVDEVHVPPSGSFTVTLPATGDDGKGGDMKVGFAIGQQETHGVFDPGLTTDSAMHAEMRDFRVTTEGANQQQEQRFERYTVDTSLKPTPNGRVDLVMNAAVKGWKSASEINGGSPVAIGIDSMRAVGQINGISRDRVTALLAATRELIGVLPPDVGAKNATKDLSEPTKAKLRLVLESLQDMLASVMLEETVDGVRVEVAGMGGLSIKRFLLALGGEAPDGRLRAWTSMAMDELASPSLPPKIAAYLPRHVEFKPTVSGVLTADLHKLALDALEDDSDDKVAQDIAALFVHGGIKLGIETLAFDLGPAAVTGTGQVTMSSPSTWQGQARVTATGFDELAAQARTNPDLQQALPVLIMMRGLAKPEGKKLVWDVVSDGPNVTVNGLDLSQLGGNGDKPKDRPPPRPAQPQRR